MRFPALFALLLGTLMFSACGPSLVSVALDNPSQEAVLVTIDSLVVEVPARSVAWVEMGFGEHDIITNDTAATFSFVEDVYFINPTLSEYLMYEEIYGMGYASLPNRKVTFYGMPIEGPYAVVRDLISPVKWDYGPREPLPEVVEVDASESYTTLIKLADAQEVFNDLSTE